MCSFATLFASCRDFLLDMQMSIRYFFKYKSKENQSVHLYIPYIAICERVKRETERETERDREREREREREVL